MVRSISSGRSARASTAPEIRPSRKIGVETTVTTPGSGSTARDPRSAATPSCGRHLAKRDARENRGVSRRPFRRTPTRSSPDRRPS
jgi:hypothetical protein